MIVVKTSSVMPSKLLVETFIDHCRKSADKVPYGFMHQSSQRHPRSHSHNDATSLSFYDFPSLSRVKEGFTTDRIQLGNVP
jgi:hypothetical protein